MKITQVKCPACGGNIEIDNTLTSPFVTCKYCGNQLHIDDEKIQHTVNNYHIYQSSPPPQRSRSSYEHTGKLQAAILCVMGVLLLILFSLGSGSKSSRRSQTYASAAKETAAKIQYSALYEELVEAIYKKPAAQVSESELANIKYLYISFKSTGTSAVYSFDDPYLSAAPEFTALTFADTAWKTSDLYAFTGITKLQLDASFTSDLNLSKFPDLKGLTSCSIELSELAATLPNPEQLIELELDDPTALDAISAFPNLECLTLNDAAVSDLKPLVTLKKLTALTVTDSETSGSASMIPDNDPQKRIADYSALAMLKSLESLSLESDLIKDISFIKELPSLTSLTLKNTIAINPEPLNSATALTALTLSGNRKFQDFKPVETLSGLRELTIDKHTTQPDPQLSALTGLEQLNICGFMSLSSLKGLTGLKELSIHSCNADGIEVLSTLSGVERLTCYSVWTSHSKLKNLDFVKGMTSLKYADFCGREASAFWQSSVIHSTEINGDISAILNHEGLEELYLDNGLFEINFSKVNENPSLKVLSMNQVSLKKNFYVESNGMMVSTWYDDVVFSEHLDFFMKFPNLEFLSINSNEVTDLSFLSGLPALTRLSLRDNYVADLSPLVHTPQLNYLDITDNPISNLDSIGEGIATVIY